MNIQIFPSNNIIQFNNNLLDDFLRITNAQKIKSQIIQMNKIGVAPIINLYDNPIINEGPGNGNLSYNGVISDARIQRIQQDLSKIGIII